MKYQRKSKSNFVGYNFKEKNQDSRNDQLKLAFALDLTA